MLSLKIQRKWQFQSGVAMIIIPFLYLVYDRSKIFNSVIEDKVVQQELITNQVVDQFNISFYFIPIQLIGVILIILTICGVFGKHKKSNKEHNK